MAFRNVLWSTIEVRISITVNAIRLAAGAPQIAVLPQLKYEGIYLALVDSLFLARISGPAYLFNVP